MRFEFDTSEYRLSHVHNPRGRGTWAFGINSRDPEPGQVLWSPSMTYTEAKAWAKRELRLCGHPSLTSDGYGHADLLWVLP
jgi:hypothetical protein